MLYGNIKIPIKILRDSYYHIKNYVMENIFLFNLIYSEVRLLRKLNSSHFLLSKDLNKNINKTFSYTCFCLSIYVLLLERKKFRKYK